MINPAAFIDNLRYMGLGMFSIFIVVGIIIGVTVLLNRIFSKKSGE